MASESVELEIQQVDGWKNEEPAWSVTNSRLVINLYRDNPALYDKNHKHYGNKAVTKKVFTLILNFWTSFQALVWWISAIPKKVSFVCSLVCTIIWSKLPQYAPSCVLVVQIDPGACSGSKTLRVYQPLLSLIQLIGLTNLHPNNTQAITQVQRSSTVDRKNRAHLH